MKYKLVAGLFLGMLVLAGCGQDSTSTTVSSNTTSGTSSGGQGDSQSGGGNQDGATDVAPNSVLPDVIVTRIATGEEIQLRSLAPSDKPLLLWFWAPH